MLLKTEILFTIVNCCYEVAMEMLHVVVVVVVTRVLLRCSSCFSTFVVARMLKVAVACYLVKY